MIFGIPIITEIKPWSIHVVDSEIVIPIWWKIFSQIGIDTGDGKDFYTIPESGTSAVMNLSQLSNVGRQGLFMLQLAGNSARGGMSIYRMNILYIRNSMMT